MQKCKCTIFWNIEDGQITVVGKMHTIFLFSSEKVTFPCNFFCTIHMEEKNCDYSFHIHWLSGSGCSQSFTIFSARAQHFARLILSYELERESEIGQKGRDAETNVPKKNWLCQTVLTPPPTVHCLEDIVKSSKKILACVGNGRKS